MFVIYATILILIVILGSSVWVGLGLAGTGIVAAGIFRSSMPFVKHLAFSMWNTATTPTMMALALFLLMAEILFKTNLANLIFSGLTPWVSRLPGKLIHTNILGCTIFASVSGSSAATTATIGRVTLSELGKRGYDKTLSMGSLAGAGTLGFLIPPSTMLIIYGILSEESILKLFLAGFVPGLIIAGLYACYIMIYCSIHEGITPEEPHRYTLKDKMHGLVLLGPVVALMLLILLSMYMGFASPTEAAAVGVFGSCLIAFLQRTLTWSNLKEALLSAARTSSMVGFIIIGAVALSEIMGFLRIPTLLASKIAALHLSPFTLILTLLVFYIFLGCIMEGMSIMVMTLPITMPLVLQAGFSKIWFGIFMVIAVELAQITPPVGFNLFIIQGLTGEKIGDVAKATMPFFFIMIFFALLIAVFPQIVTYVPSRIVFTG